MPAERKPPPRQTSKRISELPRIIVRINWAVLFLFVVLTIGTAGFYVAGGEKANFSDALYMTLITVTTVGYGEMVHLDTLGERIFTGLIAIAGFGTLTFLFTSLTVFFLEKDLDHSIRRRRMEKRIRKLQHHFIVAGFGRVGRNVAHELQSTGRHFVAIDVEEARFEDNRDKFPGLLYLHGDASDDDLLEGADIMAARGVFAVTGDDSRNLMIIITAKQLNPTVRVVARAQETRNIEKMRKAGADEIISPDFTGGMRMASAMIRPHVVSFLDQMLKSEKRLRVEEVEVPPHFPPTPLAELKLHAPEYVLLSVRDAGEWVFNPPPDYLVVPGCVLIAMASPQGRNAIENRIADFQAAA
jgi:voltage-gated potassium channel